MISPNDEFVCVNLYTYLGQMLEKGGGYVVGIFPDGLVLSSNLLKLHCVINVFGKS